MENDKRKKKNRKKNKQANKQTESVTLDATESTSDSSRVQEIGQNNNDQESGIVDAPNDVRAHVNADRDGHLANGTEATNLTEAEKQYRLDREAISECKIKDLQTEKNSQMQKEALLEERIRQLIEENDGNWEKEASLKEKIKQLHDERNASLLTEVGLKKNVIQLEKEKDVLILKEGGLQHKIEQLQREIDAYMQKEVSLEEKIKQMERERESWILKENSANESIASLTNWNNKLQAQVMELERSRENLLNETQQLKEIISSLQLGINNLEMDNKVSLEDEDAKYQAEAACALVDRLIAENSDLVEKVNELYAMLDQRGVRTEEFFTANSVPGAVTARSTNISVGPNLMPDLALRADDRHITTNHSSDSIPEASKTIPVSDSTQSLEDVMIKDQRNGELVSINNGSTDSNSSEIIEADEIVQIPLDEDGVEETNYGVAQNDEETDVSLTDSPLIGAPFRFMSYVARYVSGADLVDKNTGKPG